MCTHYLVYIFLSGFDKGTRRQKYKLNQNTSHSPKTKQEKKRTTNKSTYNHALPRTPTHILHIWTAAEHPLNLVCEINEPDNKSLHINFYRFDCGKIGSETTKSQPKSERMSRFLYSSTTDNQMRIMDQFCGRERERERAKKNIIPSWILELFKPIQSNSFQLNQSTDRPPTHWLHRFNCVSNFIVYSYKKYIVLCAERIVQIKTFNKRTKTYRSSICI